MAKSRKIGNTSMSEEYYQNFVSLGKDEQIKQIGDALHPRDYARAEKLLTRIPHGNINSGNATEATEGNTERSEADRSKSSGSGQRTSNKKG